MSVLHSDLLEQAIKEVAVENFLKEFRDWFIFTAPPEYHKVYSLYLQKLEKEQKMEFKCEDSCCSNLRPFSKILDKEKKQRLEDIIKKMRANNLELSNFLVSIGSEPEANVLHCSYEAIEDELSTLETCVKS